MRARAKICCISSVEEMRLAVRCGASAIGLVSRMPSGPGVIDEALIAVIAKETPPGVMSVLLTCATDPAAIVSQQRKAAVNAVQLCDALDVSDYRRLREELPGISLIQVIHVTGPQSVDEARTVSPFVDALLLDSGNPALAVKELGGTGRVHDWLLSRAIRESVPIPIFLAGGLNGANVRGAVDQVGPFGVDVCSGVRTGEALDERKLSAFMGGLQ